MIGIVPRRVWPDWPLLHATVDQNFLVYSRGGIQPLRLCVYNSNSGFHSFLVAGESNVPAATINMSLKTGLESLVRNTLEPQVEQNMRDKPFPESVLSSTYVVRDSLPVRISTCCMIHGDWLAKKATSGSVYLIAFRHECVPTWGSGYLPWSSHLCTSGSDRSDKEQLLKGGRWLDIALSGRDNCPWESGSLTTPLSSGLRLRRVLPLRTSGLTAMVVSSWHRQ